MRLKIELVVIGIVLVLLFGCTQPEDIAETVPEPAVPEEQPAESSAPPEVEGVSEIEVPAVNAPEGESETTREEPATEPLPEPKPCDSFFDAYTRITGGPQDSGDVLESELASLLAARMKENDVGCAVLVGIDITDFNTPQEIKDSINYYSSILRPYSETFVPFLDLDTESSSDYTTERIQQILNEAEGKIDYHGFGEISFVDPGPWKSKKFTDKPLPELITFLGQKDMVVAAHIARGQTSDLKTILTQYPHTKILVHGYPDGLRDLLVKHKNLYYAAELEIMAADGTFSCSPISTSASDVDSAIRVYKPIIAAAPNQVLWATNAHSKCHFQPGFYSRLIEFSEKFVERLPEEQQDKFAYQNALRVFGEGE